MQPNIKMCEFGDLLKKESLKTSVSFEPRNGTC